MYILEDLILPVNKKIKAIRKYLKVNQKELAGEELDRSMISYIENGKTKLTKDTANKLAKNFDKIIKKKGLTYKIDSEYILADEMRQAGYKLKSNILKLKEYMMAKDDNFIRLMKETDELLKTWDIPAIKAEVYEIAGDFNYNKRDICNSRLYYLKSMMNYYKIGNQEMVAGIFSKIAKNAIIKGDYYEAIYLNEYSLNILENEQIENDTIKKRIYFNNALAFSNMKKYENSLFFLNKLLNEYKDLDTRQYLDVLILKGNNYFRNNDFENAMKVYKETLFYAEKVNDIRAKAIAYENIGTIHYIEGEISKCIEYRLKSIELKIIKKDYSYLYTLKSLVSVYIEIGEYKKAWTHIANIIDKAKKDNNYNLLFEIYNQILDIYIEGKGKYFSEQVLYEITDFIASNKVKLDVKEMILKLCNIFIEKDSKKVKELLKIGLNYDEKEGDNL